MGLRAWLSAWRGPAPLAIGHGRTGLPRAAVWVGLALLLAASCALEWTRLYRCESRLPGHAGGVLGFTLGPLSTHWLGFAGSGVLWIAALVAGMSLALRFSWLALAEALAPPSTDCASAARPEGAGRGPPLGEAAQVEREHVVEVERQEIEDHVPIVIEPTLLEVPKSERVAKERQQPLFDELADTKLPQVDLLDAAPAGWRR